MENQDFDKLWQNFTDLVKEGNERKQRLLKSKAYKILQDLAEFYIDKGAVSASIKLDAINKELFLARDYYEDIIDIYHLQECEISSPLKEAKLDLILTLGVFFEERAIDYLSSFAFNDCPAQRPSLYLIVWYTKVSAVKSYVREILKENFLSLHEESKELVIEFLQKGEIDQEYLSSLIKLNEELAHKDSSNIEKKWWRFWK